MHLGVASAEGRRQSFHHGQGSWNCCQPEFSGEAVLERVHLLTHGARIADDAPRPVEHALAFSGESLETGTAVDQQHAEAFFELLYPRRQRRLGDPAGFRRPPEVLFTGQCEEKFQFFQQLRPRCVPK